MPGYDGTGPRGRGPMTGWGRGYCILKMPQTLNEPIAGFAGLPGEPITIFPRVPHGSAASLEAVRQIIGGPLPKTDGRKGRKRPEADAS